MAEITSIAPNENGDMVIVDNTKKALDKLNTEKDANKSHEQKLVLEHLISRAEEDPALAENVALEHKSWARCWKHIYQNAREQARSGNCAMVEDSVVYGWAEEYYFLDDKEAVEKELENEKKRKEAREKAKASAKTASKKKGSKTAKPKTIDEPSDNGKDSDKADTAPTDTPEERKEPKTHAKKDNQVEGQLSIFDYM